MEIDEQQEQNLIEISLKLNYMHPNHDRRGRWEEKIDYKLDEKSLEKYITQMDKYLNAHNDISIEEFNKIVERAAEKTLMSKYKRRLLKKLNREKRNCNDVTKRELYIKQKKLLQTKIREQ